jgi:ATP-binding cassette subfamily F protein uup
LPAQIDADEGRRTIVPGTKVVLLEQDPQSGRLSRRCSTGRIAGDDAPLDAMRLRRLPISLAST